MASFLNNYFVSCWRNHTIDEDGLDAAVTRGYLTQSEADAIKAIPN